MKSLWQGLKLQQVDWPNTKLIPRFFFVAISVSNFGSLTFHVIDQTFKSIKQKLLDWMLAFQCCRLIYLTWCENILKFSPLENLDYYFSSFYYLSFILISWGEILKWTCFLPSILVSSMSASSVILWQY